MAVFLSTWTWAINSRKFLMEFLIAKPPFEKQYDSQTRLRLCFGISVNILCSHTIQNIMATAFENLSISGDLVRICVLRLLHEESLKWAEVASEWYWLDCWKTLIDIFINLCSDKRNQIT